ncbi:EVE domain-containing protein [Variovorax sp. J2P1-59]|uniref:EVE domain-containing protein n=1 Tax=Variovorax flavidus TaxID=3053501 RepID=UPI002574A930|nr:EVE domain-containing protein [Variovorax sp. J2P1-59]MDM0076922.1 EVE domain-containing protein [Variovorax sp. J2P1-59]
MAAWIFQGNPEKFDLDGYLRADLGTITWVVRQQANKIAVGDTVYIWRSAGKDKEASGIVAECRVASPVAPMPSEPEAAPFWKEPSPDNENRVSLIVLRIASSRQVLKREWLKSDPVLRELRIFKMAQGTNFPLDDDHAARIAILWQRTGVDWTWTEAVAALWAFDVTKGREVSKLPGSPVSKVSLAIGRAITGVYNKLMNFRALDPTDDRDGFPSNADIDREVWHRFYDETTRHIDGRALRDELARLGIHLSEDAPPPVAQPQPNTRPAVGSLEALMEKYETATKQGAYLKLPKTTTVERQEFIRNTLVVAIAQERAKRKCEIPGCTTPSFSTDGGEEFCEVHHIDPLAEGGEDVIENAICLCPLHHREAHHGNRRDALRGIMKKVRIPGTRN